MFSEITEDNLEQLLASNPKVMVQYGATWCGNCKITKPKFKRIIKMKLLLIFYNNIKMNAKAKKRYLRWTI
jgi:thiol-disulfide isomerase/thioredoxin